MSLTSDVIAAIGGAAGSGGLIGAIQHIRGRPKSLEHRDDAASSRDDAAAAQIITNAALTLIKPIQEQMAAQGARITKLEALLREAVHVLHDVIDPDAVPSMSPDLEHLYSQHDHTTE